MDEDRRARARSFGQVAERYERYRPSYPAKLFTDVLGLADGARVLEAGAGTGRATRELALRGATVVAVEPDPAMADLARERCQELPVEVVQLPFEQYRPDAAAFDLVVSAQAWHWVDRQAGAAVAARAVGKQGVLALWWNWPGERDGPVWDAVQAAYARHAPELTTSGRLDAVPEQEVTTDPAPGFGPWTRDTYDWSETYSADDYCGLIGTHSNHLMLPADRRELLLSAVHDAIVGGGNGLEYRYRTVLLRAPAGDHPDGPGIGASPLG